VSDAQHAGEFAAGMHPTAPPPGSPGRHHCQLTAAPSAALMVAMITPPSVMKMNERRKPVPMCWWLERDRRWRGPAGR